MSILSFLGRNESPNLKDERLSKKPRIEQNIDDDVVPISSDDDDDVSISRPIEKQSNIKNTQKNPSNPKISLILSEFNNLIFIIYK